MVRLIGIIQMYFLFKQSQWVSNKEMGNVLGQEMIKACKDRAIGLTTKHKTPLFLSPQYEEGVSRSLGNGWIVQNSHLAQDFILQTLGKSQRFIHYLHNASWGTGVDLDTELQSKFLLLKVKKISQVFGTWNFRNKQPHKKS